MGNADENQEAFDSISQFIGALDKVKDSAANELVKDAKACLFQALGQICTDCLTGKLSAPIKETDTSTEQLKLFAASLPDDGPECDRNLLMQSASFVTTILDASGSLFTWSQIEGDRDGLGNEPALFALRRMSKCIDSISSLGDEGAIATSAKTTIQRLQADSDGPCEVSVESIQQAIVKMNEQLVTTISKWKESKAGTRN